MWFIRTGGDIKACGRLGRGAVQHAAKSQSTSPTRISFTGDEQPVGLQYLRRSAVAGGHDARGPVGGTVDAPLRSVLLITPLAVTLIRTRIRERKETSPVEPSTTTRDSQLGADWTDSGQWTAATSTTMTSFRPMRNSSPSTAARNRLN